MQILPANLDHAQAMHELHARAINTVCKDFYTKEQIEAWLKGRSPEGYYEGIKKGEMYVAEDNGKVAGFGHAIPGEVVAVYVDPDFHGEGVGKLIFDHGLEIALKGHDKVKIDSTINAQSFYEKCGCTKVRDDVDVRNCVEIPVAIMEFRKDTN